ncbi:Wadjet anti-phage system protein JetD domain-containing protein [Accumulibacter sp.]|uniref:Wadjet anti-phage system protein JetD domain-containing protein n=1 Tax=Accumulibacter sp. TaxID=2053492 RepID=UPI003453D933
MFVAPDRRLISQAHLAEALEDELYALRAHLPQVESFRMDRATLLAGQAQWGEEEKPVQRELTRLTDDERASYDDLRDNRLARHLRLEQERIGFGRVEQALADLLA